MITHSTETLILNLDTIQALLKMQRLACAFAEKLQLACHQHYDEWQKVMSKTQHFFQELEFKEKVALVTEKAENLPVDQYDITKLKMLMESVANILDSQKEVKRLNSELTNAKFYYTQLENVWDTLDKKLNQLKQE